jgi:hypothetical protein
MNAIVSFITRREHKNRPQINADYHRLLTAGFTPRLPRVCPPNLISNLIFLTKTTLVAKKQINYQPYYLIKKKETIR